MKSQIGCEIRKYQSLFLALQLTIYDEYKSMVGDIQMHFNETKRASYSGNKKRENDMRYFCNTVRLISGDHSPTPAYPSQTLDSSILDDQIHCT